jgi:D-arabinose 1-dehydrogenase-like Zn-dependent alcohol dehydrogenase
MFAVYAARPNLDDPLASLVVGERPEPTVPQGWVRVKVSHASLNRHDLFTLRGITAQQDPISFPMILGTDGAGTLDDGTPIVIYPVMGTADWRDDETLDSGWHIFSERVPGTFADYVAVPRRNAIPLPAGISALDASVLNQTTEDWHRRALFDTTTRQISLGSGHQSKAITVTKFVTRLFFVSFREITGCHRSVRMSCGLI